MCLVWSTFAWHGMGGWCKHVCVYLCVFGLCVALMFFQS